MRASWHCNFAPNGNYIVCLLKLSSATAVRTSSPANRDFFSNWKNVKSTALTAPRRDHHLRLKHRQKHQHHRQDDRIMYDRKWFHAWSSDRQDLNNNVLIYCLDVQDIKLAMVYICLGFLLPVVDTCLNKLDRARIFAQVETSFFRLHSTIHTLTTRAHLPLWMHIRKSYPYEHLRRLSRQILKIDEVTTSASLSTGTLPTMRATSSMRAARCHFIYAISLEYIHEC